MRQKMYCLLGLVGVFFLNKQPGYASQAGVQKTFSVIDTNRIVPKVTVVVKDWGSSKPLDSVHVSMGKEFRYTNNKGIAVFENNEDSVLILSKPGYGRVGKKVSSASVQIRMMKTDESLGGYVVGAGLLQNSGNMFSGSAITVSGAELRKINSLNLFEGLKFYVPSLTVTRSNSSGDDPNSAPGVNLRGTGNFPFSATVANTNNVRSGVQISPSAGDYIASNILSNHSPVILLDGIQVSLQTILDIDLNRIKNVVVLKDAAATASYGMRGGNGVIAVQTNKPQGKFEISFSEQVQVAQANTASFQPLSAKQKLEVEKNSGLFNGVWAPVYQKRYDQAYKGNVNTDWLAIPLRNSVSSKHSLVLNAGNEDIVYGLNASYNDVEGTMKGSNRKTIDLGAYFGGRIGALTFNNQFSYLGMDAANSPYGALGNYVRMNPYWDLNDPVTGKIQKIVESNQIAGTQVTFKNPAYNAGLSTLDNQKYTRFNNVTNLNWIIGAGFQLNGMASITKQSDELNLFLPPGHTDFADLTVENIFKRGSYRYTSNSVTDVQGGLRLQYRNSFEKHRLSANVGQNLSQSASESEGIAVVGFAADRLADIAFGNGYSIPKPISGKIVTRYASTFGNLGYSYDDRYQVDLSGAMDFYSALDKGAAFGAVGLAWNISNESFLKELKWLNLLRLKGSFGIAGNQGFLSYLNRTTYNYYTDQQYIPAGSGLGTIGIGLGAYLTGYANKNLQAPQTYKQDVGIEAAFFGNRLMLNVNKYKQLNYRMILPISSPASTGYQNFTLYENYGEIENNGFEAGLIANVYQSVQHNMKINLSLNVLHAKDQINAVGPQLYNVNEAGNLADQRTIQPKYVVGRSPFAIWAVPSLGIDAQTGNEIFLKKDGSSTMIWDANDKIYAGSLMPEWQGSFGADLSYHRWSFGAFFNYQYGARVYNQTMADIENADANYNLDARALSSKRWTPGTANAAYKGLFHSATYATTRLVEKDNKIQCSSIMLGYMLPKAVAEKIKAKNLGFRLMLNNAFELGGADMQRGTAYPFQRNYTFILNANF